MSAWQGFLRGIACISISLSCASRQPNLLVVERVSPDAVEQNDELLVSGQGFLEQSRASLGFSGSVHVAGEGERDVDFTVEARVQSSTSLRVEVNSDLISELLGPVDLEHDAPRHATFRGELRVAIAPSKAGAPPVTGLLSEVVLDVFDTTRHENPTRSTTSPAPSPLLERYGWRFRHNSEGQLCLTAVERADRTGPLLLGDCLLEFDGVNVFSLDDLVPQAGAREAELLLRREGNLVPQRAALDVAGLRPQSPAAWGLPLVAVSLVAGGLLLLRGPLGFAVSLLAVRRSLQAPSQSAKRSESGLRRGFVSFLAVSALLAALHAELLPALMDLDTLLVLGACTPLLLAAQLLGARTRASSSPLRRIKSSLWERLAGLGQTSLLHVVIWVCVATALLDGASLSLRELSRIQTQLPLGCLLFSSPGAYLAGAVLLVAATLLTLLDFPAGSGSVRHRLQRGCAHALCDVYTWALAGLFVALYAGGWGVPAWLTGGRTAPTSLSLLVFQVKFSALYLGLVWARHSTVHLSHPELRRLFARYLLPAASVGAALQLVWLSGTWPSWLHLASTRTLAFASLLVCIGLLVGFARVQERPQTTSLNPWL